MQTDSDSPPQSKPQRSTRSSIRQSLNLASVGKALVDVMNKDAKLAESRKATSKGKEAHVRRVSTIGIPRGGDGPQGGIERQPNQPKPSPKKTASPDMKTITRSNRTVSSSSAAPSVPSDELGFKGKDEPQPSSSVTRSTSVLRPRNVVKGSALPKYRPKSVVVEELPKKPSSPARAGTRRKHSSSEEDDQKDGVTPVRAPFILEGSAKAVNKPISPIPRRSISRFPATSNNNTPHSVKHNAVRSADPVSTKVSTPTRLSKVAKPSFTPSGKHTSSPQPSPPSPSRRVNGRTPTPVAAVHPRLRELHGHSHLRPGAKDHSPSPASRRINKLDGPNLARPVARTDSSSPSTSYTCLPGDSSTDSVEVDDVEMMLASVASPTGPTPAIPRFKQMMQSQFSPQTPSRSTRLQRQDNLSPSALGSGGVLSSKGHDLHEGKGRGSLLSFHQLTDDVQDPTVNGDVVGMISEISAPFPTSVPVSPSPGLLHLDATDAVSPSPYQLPSPGGYASISQMLLPNVTPSPAPPIHSQLFDDLIPELPSIDAAALTMLRLQLASAENLAGERLLQIQSLEGQLCALKQSKQSVEQELALNVSQLEAQMRESLAGRARAEIVDQLQGQLRDAETCLQSAVYDAIAEERSKSQSEMKRLLQNAESKWTISTSAQLASDRWNDVRDMAECEIELITAKREALAVILADLESRHVLLQ